MILIRFSTCFEIEESGLGASFFCFCVFAVLWASDGFTVVPRILLVRRLFEIVFSFVFFLLLKQFIRIQLYFFRPNMVAAMAS